ncbi:MAG: hypothetical protein NTX64_09815 [Elusimicrobia bacterium]|nr:hypothetical protein [Elusimicrobiota bacterium]
MKATAPRTTPVRFTFEAEEGREDGWGRFERLHPLGGRVLTRFRLEPGDRLLLTFDAAGESFEDVPAKVELSRLDEDGYRVAEVRLADEVEAHRLGAALRGLVIRAAAPPSPGSGPPSAPASTRREGR